MGAGAQPYGMGGGQGGCAQVGGAHVGGLQIGLGGGGASMAPITAAGMPMQAPQIPEQAPSNPPHKPKGEGGLHDGGAQGCGVHAYCSGAHIEGPAAVA
jgi:hypothetical protein